LQAETLAKEDLRRDSYIHRIDMVHNALSADNLGRALLYLKECPEDLREWEWHYLMRLCLFDPLVIQDKTEVHGVAFSPDGEQLASGEGNGPVKIWTSTPAKPIQTIPAHSKSVVSVAFHPEGKHLASRGADRKVRVWDLTTRQEVFSNDVTDTRPFGSAYTIAFSRDGRQLASGVWSPDFPTDGV